MANFFYNLTNNIRAGRRLIVARIIRQTGSAPRTTGTKCLILEDGTLQGTIGGGLLEYEVIQAAADMFITDTSAILNFELSGTEVAGTDMLCGGKVDVYLEPVNPNSKTARDVFEMAAKVVDEGQRGVLITLISEGIRSKDESCRMFISEDGSSRGLINNISEKEVREFVAGHEMRKYALEEIVFDGPLVFVEAVEPDDVLYLFGAGHVSIFVASLAGMVGFRVVVIDDREEFANKERFPDADEIIVLPFKESFEKIVVTPSSYFAIITRGHVFDREVLEETLSRSSGYIGMIGSKRKRDVIYRALMDGGVSEQRLKEVHSPIGLDIGAETPEEIAVSIVGQLIRERAGGKGNIKL